MAVLPPLRSAAPWLTLLLGGLALAAPAPPGDAPRDDERAFQERVRPVVGRYCAPCHGGEDPQADLDLSAFDSAASVRAEPELWALARELVEVGEMPPAGEPRPSGSELTGFTGWLAEAVGGAPAAEPGDPGPAPLRRLTRTEYRNSVRDLCGVDFPAEEFFPDDGAAGGFDNAAEALSLSDLLFEKYLEAAERIAAEAIVVDDTADPPLRRFEVGELGGPGANRAGNAMGLYSAGEVRAEVLLPRAGEYLMKVRAWADQAGPEPARMELRVDGEAVRTVEVEATRDEPWTYEARVQAEGGARRFGAAFVNDYYEPDDPDPSQRDRNLYVARIEVGGPYDPLPPTPFQVELLHRFGPELGKGRVKALLGYMIGRVWRRPATDAEVGRLERLTADAGSLEERLQLSLAALLSSPLFLFRLELDPSPSRAVAVRPLDGFELATRLSYFLWSSTPDEELFAAAARGELETPDGLEGQVERLLADSRARALADSFAAQWLQIGGLARATPDPERFPGFDAGLAASMRAETLTFFETVLREDLSVWELIEGEFSFADGRLARHYGLEGSEDLGGDELVRVSLAGTPRRGLLTQASVLTVTSNPTRTSPVKRGKWVLETLLGSPPPPPPPGADNLDESPAAEAEAPLTERLARHRADPACAVCHARMDPLGVGLENFDAVGAWRETDGRFPIEAVGELPDGRRFEGPLELVETLRADGAFPRTLVEKLLAYALGRPLRPGDRSAVDGVLAGLDPERPTLRGMIHGIALSPAFRQRRGDTRK